MIGWLRALWRRWAPAWVETPEAFDRLNHQIAAALAKPPKRLHWRVLPPAQLTRLARQWGLTTMDAEGLTVGTTVLTAHRGRGLVAHEIAHAYGADERTARRVEGDWA